MHSVSSGLLERETELARIEAAIDAACAAREGALILIEGPAGIGKSSLLQAGAEIAGERMTVLAARVTELERGFAFGAVRQMLEPAVRTAPAQRRADLLAGAAAHAVTALGLADADRATSESGFATLNGLYWLVSGLSEQRPLLLLLDDAHWADRDSLRFLTFLVPRLVDLPVVLLVAARPDEWPVDAALAGTASDPAAKPVVPRALSREATSAVVAASLGPPVDPAFAHACHRTTGGNPFYLRALVDQLRYESAVPSAAAAERVLTLGSRAVTQTLLARLARISPAAPRVARAVAVLGDDALPHRIARLAEIDQAESGAAITAMVRASILADTEPVSFAHPILRTAIYSDTGGAERARLHARALDLLRSDGAGLERMVAHLLAVEPPIDPALVDLLHRAATDALGRGAVGSAVTYLRRALSEVTYAADRVAVLRRLGCAEVLVDGTAAIEHLTEAFDEAVGPVQRADVASDLGRALIFAGRGAEAVAVTERALAGLDSEHGPLRRTLQAVIFAVAKTDPAFANVREALVARLATDDSLDADDTGAKALAVGLAYVDAHACVPATDVVPRVVRGLSGGHLIERDNGGTDFIAAVIVLAMADSDLALPTLAQGVALARERGDVFAAAANAIFSCLAHLGRGSLADAVAAGEEGLAASDSYGIAIGRPWGGGYLATAQLASGDLDAAERTLARTSTPADIPFTGIWLPFVDARARVRLARGEYRAALEDSRWCGTVMEALGQTNPALVPWRSRTALCLLQLGGDPRRVIELAEEEVGLARRWGAPRALGSALRARGLVATGTDDPAGTDMLREAVSVLDGSPARLEHARALVDLGAALRRRGHRRECRQPLRDGMSLARSCGAVTLAERAYDELRADGARPRKLIHAGQAALTPSERRVARLAAAGAANREIAQELFVSVKTVEWHLGQVFAKLGISSRAQLAGSLGAGT